MATFKGDTALEVASALARANPSDRASFVEAVNVVKTYVRAKMRKSKSQAVAAPGGKLEALEKKYAHLGYQDVFYLARLELSLPPSSLPLRRPTSPVRRQLVKAKYPLPPAYQRSFSVSPGAQPINVTSQEFATALESLDVDDTCRRGRAVASKAIRSSSRSGATPSLISGVGGSTASLVTLATIATSAFPPSPASLPIPVVGQRDHLERDFFDLDARAGGDHSNSPPSPFHRPSTNLPLLPLPSLLPPLPSLPPTPKMAPEMMQEKQQTWQRGQAGQPQVSMQPLSLRPPNSPTVAATAATAPPVPPPARRARAPEPPVPSGMSEAEVRRMLESQIHELQAVLRRFPSAPNSPAMQPSRPAPSPPVPPAPTRRLTNPLSPPSGPLPPIPSVASVTPTKSGRIDMGPNAGSPLSLHLPSPPRSQPRINTQTHNQSPYSPSQQHSPLQRTPHSATSLQSPFSAGSPALVFELDQDSEEPQPRLGDRLERVKREAQGTPGYRTPPPQYEEEDRGSSNGSASRGGRI